MPSPIDESSAPFSFAVSGNNCILSYSKADKAYTAKVRVRKISYEYVVTSTESQARTNRAYYPHRRAHGKFHLLIECIGYSEFKQFMSWLKIYSDTVLDTRSNILPAAMEVTIANRNFHRIGIMCSGINDHDNVGSMVFPATLEFVTLQDFNDPAIETLASQGVSNFNRAEFNPALSDFFYPITSTTATEASLFNGQEVDPLTGFPIDPVSGYARDPATGRLYSTETGGLIWTPPTKNGRAI